jgi:5'-nucleotidase
MRILISNDDGIDSAGLKALRNELEEHHEVWISAPEQERSGTSHSVSLHEPVRFRRLEERVFACSGSPADAVMYALLGAVPVIPEVILSGINLGPNLGTDIIYSGTAAAARQGALVGIPSMAVSAAALRPPFPFTEAARFMGCKLEELVRLWRSDHFININYPTAGEEEPSTVITHPSRRIYNDSVSSFTSPKGHVYYFLNGAPIHAREEKGSDWNAIQEGKISISPVYLHPMNHQVENHYRKAGFSLQDEEEVRGDE